MARGLRRGPVLLRFRSLVDSVAHYVAGIVDARQLSKVRYTLRDCYLSALALFFVHGMWLPFAITLWCQGTVGTFMRGPGPHELGHGTVFKTRAVAQPLLPGADVAAHLVEPPRVRDEPHLSPSLHALPGGRPRGGAADRSAPEAPLDILQRLTFNVQGMFQVIGATVRMAIPYYRRDLNSIRTKWTEALFKLAPEVERKAVRFARLTILFHYQTPLPPSAHPAVLSEEDARPCAQGRARRDGILDRRARPGRPVAGVRGAAPAGSVCCLRTGGRTPATTPTSIGQSVHRGRDASGMKTGLSQSLGATSSTRRIPRCFQRFQPGQY